MSVPASNLCGVLPVLFLALLGGCASIVDGSNQSLSVDTTSQGKELAGAECALTNDKGKWFVTTPGTVTVHRSYDAMNVKCTDAGYEPAIATSASSTKAMAFGNILFGGLIGAGVDISTGAAYDYPALITVPMMPEPAAMPTPAQATPQAAPPATS